MIRFVRKGIPCINAALLACVILYFLVYPVVTVIRDTRDPYLSAPGIPASAWRLHETLAPRYAKWAAARLDSTRATEINHHDISGTEWPLFGSVFYLWSMESLQEAWEKDPSPAKIAPATYARDAIEAATKLVIDPSQANWVKIHWGENYLKTENVFYRMLVIAALTSHAQLTGSQQYYPLLRNQIDSLAAELDASPRGLLYDYPGECYPADIITAVAMIRRADKVLGTDHSAFAERALRAFQGKLLDDRGLVPYAADPVDGTLFGTSRGCGNSYVSLFAPELWPAQAKRWYDLYGQYFWQEKWTIAGFREFPNDIPSREWYFDVDSGPVFNGFGCSACAFGTGAARTNGNFNHAYQLGTEMLATSWPLPDGTLLIPRFLSNAADAPYLGESAILFSLTRQPAEGATIVERSTGVPGFVLLFLTLQGALAFLILAALVRSVRRYLQGTYLIPKPKVQLVLWTALLIAAAVCLLSGLPLPGLILFFCSQLLPRGFRGIWKKPAAAAA